jgi:hypothetical protein
MNINLTCALLCALGLCSCERDKPQSTSPEPATQESSDIVDNRPKAPMELFRTMQIADYPLALRVPEKWELKFGPVLLLRGPTPNGPLPDGIIHLVISRQGPLHRSVVDAIKPPTTKPTTKPATNDALVRDQLTVAGQLRIHERRSVQPATGGLPEMMKWTISVYEQIDRDNSRLYQISFLDLTREHFEKDRQLLESMVASLGPPQASSETIK